MEHQPAPTASCCHQHWKATRWALSSTGKGQETKQINVTNRNHYKTRNWKILFSIPEKLEELLGMPSRKEMREESDLLKRRMELLHQNEESSL